MTSITAECIQASRDTQTGKTIYTLVCQYSRVIHSQLLTHRVFSKNSSSTRAVPLATAIDQIINNPAEYVWTMNQSGMQGELATPEEAASFEATYLEAMKQTIKSVEELAEKGAHKQNAGRLLEPYQNIKIVLTATEWANWDWLRDDEDAQGEIAELARAISKARDEAEVMELAAGEWHVPGVDRVRDPISNELRYYIEEKGEPKELTLEEAQAVSSSFCAQVSYRRSDTSLAKAARIKDMLIKGRKVHASPFEHQATPILAFSEEHGFNTLFDPSSWEEGVTHVDRDKNFWSNNLQGFIQHRSLIPNNVKK